jgi:hypothetical protein
MPERGKGFLLRYGQPYLTRHLDQYTLAIAFTYNEPSFQKVCAVFLHYDSIGNLLSEEAVGDYNASVDVSRQLDIHRYHEFVKSLLPSLSNLHSAYINILEQKFPRLTFYLNEQRHMPLAFTKTRDTIGYKVTTIGTYPSIDIKCEFDEKFIERLIAMAPKYRLPYLTN